MKILPGSQPKVDSAGQPASTQPSQAVEGSKSKPVGQAPDLQKAALAKELLGKDKGALPEVAKNNAEALPDVGLAYQAPSKAAAEEAGYALDKTIAATLETAVRRAKQNKDVPPSETQILLGQAERLIVTHHAIAEGYDKNLEGKSPQEIARRQEFSRAVLADLSAKLWEKVPMAEAFRMMPQAMAALLLPSTAEGKAAIDAQLHRAELAGQVFQMLSMIGDAERGGMKLATAEKSLLLKASQGADADPQAAFESIAEIAKRAEKHLNGAREPVQQPMSKADLDALRAQMKEEKAAKTQPSPEQKFEKGLERMAELEAQVKDAPVPTMAERFEGAMVGLAIGDALGGPTEFMARKEIFQRHGLVTDMIGGGWLHLKPGEYTDDTQMAVAMAESIVAKGKLDPNDLGDRFVSWLNSDPKDVGNLTRSALELRRIGVDAVKAGEIPWKLSGFENAGNGSVMRAAPVALLTAFAPENEIAKNAELSSAVSHADPRCRYGTAAISLAVSLIVKGEEDVIGEVVKWLEPRSAALAEAIAQVPDLKMEDVRTSGFVQHTVQAAFWALHHAKSYVDGVIKVSNLGEDTDTAGATAGILLGAKFGLKGIPSDWQQVLQNRDGLIKLADNIQKLAEA